MKNIRKIGIFIALGLLLTIGLNVFINYLSTGSLIVEVNIKDSVVVVQKVGEKTTSTFKAGSSKRLKAGSYLVIATANGLQTSGKVDVRRLKDSLLSLTLIPLLEPIKLASYPARDLHLLGNGDIIFVNTEFSELERLPSGQSQMQPYLSSFYQIHDATWLNETQALVTDMRNNPFLLQSGKISLITLEAPGLINGVIDPDRLILNEFGHIIFNYNDNYYLKTSAATPSSVISFVTSNSDVAVSADGKVLHYPKYSGSEGGKTDAKKIAYGVTNLAGKQLPNMVAKNGVVGSASWSRDSQKVAYSDNSGLYVYNFGSQTNTQIVAYEVPLAKTLTWLDDNSLIYAYKNQIWKASVKEQATTAIANFKGSINPFHAFSVSADGKTVYFATESLDPLHPGSIYSLSLK